MLVVTSQADGVASGLSKIAHSLAEMKSAMKGGFGSTLTKLANQIERLAQALDKIDAKKLSVVKMEELASQCFIKQGEPLKLAKPKKEISADADEIENFLPTISDL